MSRFFTNRMSLEFKEKVYLLYAQICRGRKSATVGLFPPFNGHLDAMNLLTSLRAFLQALRESDGATAYCRNVLVLKALRQHLSVVIRVATPEQCLRKMQRLRATPRKRRI